MNAMNSLRVAQFSIASLMVRHSRFFQAGIRNGSALLSVKDKPYSRQSWLLYSFACCISLAL